MKKKLLITYSVTLLFLFIFFAIPIPYYSVFPGNLINLQDIVTTSQTKETHFYALSAKQYNNPYPKLFGLTKNPLEINLFIFIVSKLNPTIDLIAVSKEERKKTAQEMNDHDAELFNNSIQLSKQLALQYLNLSENISIDIQRGSSAGLIIALEIINQLDSEDLIKNRKIAGTGELNESGHVKAIGGISQKIVVAEKNNVDLLILPKVGKNKHKDTYIDIIYVETLNEAIEKLQSS